MEMWTDIPQQVWKANFINWLIYFVSVVCCAIYMLRNWHRVTNEVERRFILMDVLFWMFIVPFIITFGFALVMFSGIGVLAIVVDYYGY